MKDIRSYLPEQEILIPLQVRVGQKTLDEVRKEANKIDLTVSDIVRASLKRFLDEQKRK